MRKICAHYVLVNSQYRKYAIISIKGTSIEVGESNDFLREEAGIEFYNGTLVVKEYGGTKQVFHFQEINLERKCFALDEGINVL